MKRKLFFPLNVLLLFCLNLALNVFCSQERPPHRNHTMLSTVPLISLTAFRKGVWTQILILGGEKKNNPCKKHLAVKFVGTHSAVQSSLYLVSGILRRYQTRSLPNRQESTNKQVSSSTDTSCFCSKDWVKVCLENNIPDGSQRNVRM